MKKLRVQVFDKNGKVRHKVGYIDGYTPNGVIVFVPEINAIITCGTNEIFAIGYVSLETAKVLKEEGYNEPCHFWYDIDGNIACTVTAQTNTPLPINEIDELLAVAPELHEVQQWLREEHNLSVEPVYYQGSKWWVDIMDMKVGQQEFAEIIKETYEEALEAGINEALKMI